jgi:ADP-ribosylation factor related protein 1
MSWLSSLFKKKEVVQEATILVLGASGAGKTTLIRYLETGKPVEEDPRTTLGIDIRKKPINISNWKLQAIDVGGQEIYREALWGLGVSQADAIIYIIDGTLRPKDETDEYDISKFSFEYMLKIVDQDMPLLILINKQDLEDQNPITIQESMELYNIAELVGRSFNILPTSAKYGDGVETAIDWLIQKIKEAASLKE